MACEQASVAASQGAPRPSVDDGRGRTLTVGVLVDSPVMPRWMIGTIQSVCGSPVSELAFVAFGRAGAVASWRARLRETVGGSLYRLYTWIDDRLHATEGDALEMVDITEALPALSRDRLTSARGLSSDVRVDVMLNLSSAPAPPDLLTRAAFGVWHFCHGRGPGPTMDAAFFAEMASGESVAETTLEAITGAAGERIVLYRSWAATDATSFRRGRNATLWKSTHFVERCLKDMHAVGWRARAAGAERRAPSGRPQGVPGNLVMARFILRAVGLIIFCRLQELAFRDQWFILYRRRPHADQPVGPESTSDDVVSRIDELSLSDFEALAPPRNSYFADPFLVREGGADHVIFERFDWTTRQGHIESFRIGSDAPSAVSHKPAHHVSYPCCFWAGSDLYMVPETMSQGTIELYRALRFPDEWSRECVIAEGLAASDPTIFHDGFRYWLFASVAEPGASPNDELCLFFADDLRGKWTPHPQNPVVSDVRRARPAGAVFRSGECWIRPGQDCSIRYGSAVVFHRIEELSPTSYRESECARLDGHSLGMLGVHTYNRNEDYETIDALRRLWRTGRVRQPS